MELANLLPGVKVARMDLDTTAGRAGHLAVLERFSSGEKDVLLGTQMVAKGHHYPNVTLIGVLSADRGLSFPDFRAAEQTFRLLFQAAGRTGRGEKGGRVLIQTLAPEHSMYRYLAKHDYEGFAEEELGMRKALGYPPAGRLMLFTVSARAREQAESARRDGSRGRSSARSIPRSAAVLGPTPGARRARSRAAPFPDARQGNVRTRGSRRHGAIGARVARRREAGRSPVGRRSDRALVGRPGPARRRPDST